MWYTRCSLLNISKLISTFYTNLIPEVFFCRENYVLLSDKYLQEILLFYYVMEIVKICFRHFAFIDSLRKPETKHRRKNNKHSVQQEVYSQSGIFDKECKIF